MLFAHVQRAHAAATRNVCASAMCSSAWALPRRRLVLPLFLNGHSSLGDASSVSAGGQPVRQSSNMPSWVVPSTAAANTVVPCLFCDGASRGNPGAGGAGAIIFSPGGLSVLAFQHQRLGDSVTNNAAEYEAVRMGLELAQNAGIQNVHLFLDSQLIVKQLLGQYAVKAPQLKPLNKAVKQLLCKFSASRVSHVPRADNASADLLANAALDARGDIPELFIAAAAKASQ